MATKKGDRVSKGNFRKIFFQKAQSLNLGQTKSSVSDLSVGDFGICGWNTNSIHIQKKIKSVNTFKR